MPVFEESKGFKMKGFPLHKNDKTYAEKLGVKLGVKTKKTDDEARNKMIEERRSLLSKGEITQEKFDSDV